VTDLALDQARRREAMLDAEIDAYIDARLDKVTLAAPIGEHAKIKLRGILKKYAKDPHPFRACVKDNMKRFGPGRTEAVCATLKDTIRGKMWRKGGRSDKGMAGLSEPDVVIDGDVLIALDAISEADLMEIFLEVRALDEHQTREATALLGVSGASELRRWGDGLALEERTS
jgi:hypothetical protein